MVSTGHPAGCLGVAEGTASPSGQEGPHSLRGSPGAVLGSLRHRPGFGCACRQGPRAASLLPAGPATCSTPACPPAALVQNLELSSADNRVVRVGTCCHGSGQLFLWFALIQLLPNTSEASGCSFLIDSFLFIYLCEKREPHSRQRAAALPSLSWPLYHSHQA